MKAQQERVNEYMYVKWNVRWCQVDEKRFNDNKITGGERRKGTGIEHTKFAQSRIESVSAVVQSITNLLAAFFLAWALPPLTTAAFFCKHTMKQRNQSTTAHQLTPFHSPCYRTRVPSFVKYFKPTPSRHLNTTTACIIPAMFVYCVSCSALPRAPCPRGRHCVRLISTVTREL